MRLLNAAVKQLLVSALLLFSFTTLALADGIEGTWRLIKRELPDGTVQTPPTVVGLGTTTHGLRHLNVFWQTPDGKPASIGVISKVKLTAHEYTETLIAFTLDDGSGNPAVYNFSGETRTAAVMRQGGRISYKLPFDPPSVVYEGDKLTATLEGEFVDYWERVKQILGSKEYPQHRGEPDAQTAYATPLFVRRLASVLPRGLLMYGPIRPATSAAIALTGKDQFEAIRVALPAVNVERRVEQAGRHAVKMERV